MPAPNQQQLLSTPIPPIILYHYPFSPYARRVVWYLRLRGIPYLECIQPPTLPRPEITNLLGLQHRRIPILAVGSGDIYLDTRLILRKLEEEELIPPSVQLPPLGAPKGTTSSAIQQLLSLWTTSSGSSDGSDSLFRHAQNLLSGADLPLLKDEGFLADRVDFNNGRGLLGGGGGDDDGDGLPRQEAMLAIREVFVLLEGTVLADGRDWVLGTGDDDGPKLADIEAVWLIHWLTGLKGALDESVISPEKFPRVYAWVERFQRRVTEAKGRVEVRSVDGREAKGIIDQAKAAGGVFDAAAAAEVGIDESDPVVRFYGLKKGDVVEVWPTDSGSAHVDVGRLVGIGEREVVFETLGGEGEGEGGGYKVHAPRKGFRVRPVRPDRDGSGMSGSGSGSGTGTGTAAKI